MCEVIEEITNDAGTDEASSAVLESAGKMIIEERRKADRNTVELINLRTRHAALLAAAEKVNCKRYIAGESATERFERLAEMFYADTGLLAPGKDGPNVSGLCDHEDRRLSWEQWFIRDGEALEAAIAACREGT
jgi:hypothetical protein